MNSLAFQWHIGGTGPCMNRTMKATKRFGQLPSSDTFFSDICFIVVKTLEEGNAQGVDVCGTDKTSHKRFCMATLEN